MAAQTLQARTNLSASPARWQAALGRALADGVTVRQVNETGQWVATSGTDATMAYLMEITGTVAHGCSCAAGQHGDLVCRHRARFYFDAGLLALDDNGPDDPAPVAIRPCFWCSGSGRVPNDYHERYDACSACEGTGTRPAPQPRRIAA